MAKRTDSERSSPVQSSSPKRNRLRSDEMGVGNQPGISAASDLESFKLIMDKLACMDNRMEEHFGELKSEISRLRYEFKEEIEGVKTTLRDVEKYLQAAWDAIGDLQEITKTNSDFKKTCQSSLDKQRQDLDLLKDQKKFDSQQIEIQDLKSKLADEQEKIIALENYSRKENLRFMNIPERNQENCMDIIYYIIEHERNISAENIQFHAVHRVGKPRSTDDQSDAYPRPIIARFLCREDRDTVFRAKGRLKKSSTFKDAYITQDYARAIQMERKTLIKAMFEARGKGLNAKVVDRNLIVDNVAYRFDNIPDNLKPSTTAT